MNEPTFNAAKFVFKAMDRAVRNHRSDTPLSARMKDIQEAFTKEIEELYIAIANSQPTAPTMTPPDMPTCASNDLPKGTPIAVNSPFVQPAPKPGKTPTAVAAGKDERKSMLERTASWPKISVYQSDMKVLAHNLREAQKYMEAGCPAGRYSWLDAPRDIAEDYAKVPPTPPAAQTETPTDWQPPDEIIRAAYDIDKWMQTMGCGEWQLGPCASRATIDRLNGLVTAHSGTIARLKEALREDAISADIIHAENEQRGHIHAIRRDAKFIKERTTAALAITPATYADALADMRTRAEGFLGRLKNAQHDLQLHQDALAEARKEVERQAAAKKEYYDRIEALSDAIGVPTPRSYNDTLKYADSLRSRLTLAEGMAVAAEHIIKSPTSMTAMETLGTALARWRGKEGRT